MPDGNIDGALWDGGRPDGGTGTSEPSPPAQVLVEGSAGFLLRGAVLQPEGAMQPGEVLVVGGSIRCVAADCAGEAGASEATVIETHGVISPGLIDAHNHIAYNFLPEWEPPMAFGNRYEWADDPSYESHIAPYADNRSRGSHFCPAAKWGELRALVHGTTTVQGQSFEQNCIDRLVRNADHFHGLGYDHMQTSISSVRDITDEQAAGYVANFLAATRPTTRLAVHMAEGVEGRGVDDEFASFAGRDPRRNRHAGTSLLAAPDGAYRGTAMLIHSVILTDAELSEALESDAKIVWSPSSNVVLYGETAPIDRMLELGLTVALGPDWTPSGEDEMLSEMRFATLYAQSEGMTAVTPQRLVHMATQGGAQAVGLDDHIGRLEPGLRADLVVFGRRGDDPYQALIDSRAQDVRLVMIDGEVYYGDSSLEMATAVNGSCDMVDACGAPKFLCVQDTPGSSSRNDEALDDVRAQLVDILDDYGRGDELLELIRCD